MRRRNFIMVIAGTAAGWPIAVRAQPPAKIPTIGFLGPTAADAWTEWTKAFVNRLAELGWINGSSVNIVFRWANGHPERFGELAAELVKLKVDLILTSGSATRQTMSETSQIPIVFALASDPVATGMVASLARPGGNVTGLSLVSPELAGKRLGLLQSAVPKMRRVAVLVNVGYPASMLEQGQVKDAIAAMGLEFVPIRISRAEEIVPSLKDIADHADALYVCSSDPLINNNRDSISALALAAKMPTLFGESPYAEAGGLMSYGPNVSDMFKRAAELVDRILRGAKPADIPVEQPTTFDLVLNLKTAKALGLTLPQPLLATADELIE
jgi:putative tryptophan/tyrosine transport system substrate-binding protein